MTAPPPAVTFDYTTWISRYPEFANVGQDLGQAYFDEAGSFCANSAGNPAFCQTVYQGSTPVTLLSRLLYMLTSHIAWLNAPRDANGNPSSTGSAPAPSIVGRVSSASEGSVSVSTELSAGGSPSEAWFTQTKYGFSYWQASAGFRTMLYQPQPTIVADGVYPYIPAGRFSRRGGW